MTAKYFLIEAVVQNAPMTLAEVTEDHRHISRGEAPVEGAELQRILDARNRELGIVSSGRIGKSADLELNLLRSGHGCAAR